MPLSTADKILIGIQIALVVVTIVMAVGTIMVSNATRDLVNQQIELTDTQIDYINYQMSSDIFFNVYNNKIAPYAIEGNDLFLGYKQFKENPEIIIEVVNRGLRPIVFSVVGFGSCTGKDGKTSFSFMTTNRKETVEAGKRFTEKSLLNNSLLESPSLPCELVFQLTSGKIVLQDKIILEEKVSK